MQTGILRKLKAKHNDIVTYQLPLTDKFVDLNPLIGKEISLTHTGRKFCIDTGKEIKKTYGQGYSWEAYVTLAECDQCIVQPELCHYAKGTCRDAKWGDEHCMQPHIIYLSLTSNLKIGITRKTQIPTRWIDQGATQAIKLCEVKDRLTSGLIEVEIAKSIGDKTNWRVMLKNECSVHDLEEEKANIIKQFGELLAKHQAKIADDEIYNFQYPVETYPTKVSSLNFDKNPSIESTLLGIKGQYLIFKSGVINIRKFQGYEVELNY